MKKLIKRVVRSFYELHHVVIADILLEKVLLYDSEICDRMKMLSKEFNKLVLCLKEDRIIKFETKLETKDDNRQYLRTVYYINYAEVRDVIKYKIFKMANKLEENIKKSDMDGYKCLKCNKEFSVLDAQVLVDNYVFRCDECMGELVENNSDKSVDAQLHSLLMANLKEIIEILKETDKFNIPSMDYFQVLEYKREKEAAHVKNEVLQEESVVELNINDATDMSYTSILGVRHDVKAEDSDVETKQLTDHVYVDGKRMLFKDITEDDKEKMSEEEYERYFEVYMRYNE